MIGKNIGRYHIKDSLGEGGMASVYKAYDITLERDVAIKFIRKEAVSTENLGQMISRFQREAKSLARLLHPNIVNVFDYGEFDGSPYLVMAYIKSGNLKDKMGTPIPWQNAIRMILPIAQALGYAHSQNIIHRDVKPANILITESNDPMLSDFGIAKILHAEGSTQLTGTGVGIGTPEYMAPEQWTGKVVPQTDQYALGIVFYEMITGHRPFSADTPAAVLIKQVSDPLPSPRTFIPSLPDFIENIILKTLSKKPEYRYSNMEAFIDVLEKALLQNENVRKPDPVSFSIPDQTQLDFPAKVVATGFPPPIPTTPYSTNLDQRRIQVPTKKYTAPQKKTTRKNKKLILLISTISALLILFTIILIFFIFGRDWITSFLPANISVAETRSQLATSSELTIQAMPTQEIIINETIAPPTPDVFGSTTPFRDETPTLESTSIQDQRDEANCNQVTFINDVTIPDDTIMRPGESFIKTWRVKNTGTCTWTDDYHIFFSEGDRMQGPEAVQLGAEVFPGDQIDISVPLISPSSAGTYQGMWQIGSIYNNDLQTLKLWVKIRVMSETGETPLPTTGN
ncbi:MAG: protein kinase [Anaerolineaceae bacterium]|nr:protein kinase [Anaerolineaceae bacterium]